MPDTITLLQRLTTILSEVTTVDGQLQRVDAGFAPPPDPDRSGCIERITSIQSMLADCQSHAASIATKLRGSTPQ